MTKLLYIKASPRGANSRSIALADAYLAQLGLGDAGLVVDEIDLWQNLPTFDGNKANAKLAVITRQTHTDEQRTAWDEITAIADRFATADHYLLAVPMWNGGIPYRLKHYIDIIHQPGLLFGMNAATGYFGLLKEKTATLVLTSGAYSPSAPSPAFGVDHHATYLRFWLNQAGVSDIEEIRYQPTVLTADAAAGLAAAMADARNLAVSRRAAAA